MGKTSRVFDDQFKWMAIELFYVNSNIIFSQIPR